MVELFAISGFGGEFHCSVHRPVNGNPAVQGLKLKPHKHGVLIEANYGKRDDILQFSVIAPQDPRDPSKFLEILKKGQEALANEEEDEALARRASYGRGGDSNFSAESESYRQKQRVASAVVQPVASHPADVPAPAPTAPAPIQPAVASGTIPRSTPFYKDMTLLALFMGELEKHATQDAVVTRTNCIAVLTKDFSVKDVSTGAVLRGIIGDGHLAEVAGKGELLRFGGMWLTAWQNKRGVTEPSTPPVQDGAISIGDLLSIDTLTDEAQRLRLRREELEATLGTLQPRAAQIKAELLELEPKVAKMKIELAGLDVETTNSQRELDGILTELSDPKYAKAQSDLALLQKLLGKKL